MDVSCGYDIDSTWFLLISRFENTNTIGNHQLPLRKMNWEQLQKFLQGKMFLIGLTFIEKDRQLIEQYQTHGTVEILTDTGLLKIKRKDGSVFQIPYDKDTIRAAGKGEYRERATGEIINDPDFIMTWEVITDRYDDLSDLKIHGYIPTD
jgi:hypothetical protein